MGPWPGPADPGLPPSGREWVAAAQGQGLAGALLAAAETAARASGMTRLTTEASHAARPVFHRAGFRTLYPRTLWRAGQWLHNTAMAKDLAEDP